ncbi:unnamed protein product, partial [marine sediment metagenome]
MSDDRIPIVMGIAEPVAEDGHTHYAYAVRSAIERVVRDVLKAEHVLVADNLEDRVSDLRVGDIVGDRWEIVMPIGKNPL